MKYVPPTHGNSSRGHSPGSGGRRRFLCLRSARLHSARVTNTYFASLPVLSPNPSQMH